MLQTKLFGYAERSSTTSTTNTLGQGIVPTTLVDDPAIFFTKPLNEEQAALWAYSFVDRLPIGGRFTCYELFHNKRFVMETKANRKFKVNKAITPLRQSGKIVSVGAEKGPREQGNSGWNTVWERRL